MKKLLLVPVLAVSLLVGCAKGNAYVPEDITLDEWLDGAEKTRNNMYDIYQNNKPIDLDADTPVDWNNYIIKTIKENVTSTTPRKKAIKTSNDKEYLWYALNNPKHRTEGVMLYVFENCIVTSADINYAGDVISQVLYYDLEPAAGEKIINAAKNRIKNERDAEAYETEKAKNEGTIEYIIESAKKVENDPVIKYQGSTYKDTDRSLFSDLTFEECKEWTNYFKQDSDDKNIGPFLFTYTINDNLMVGVDLQPHDRYVDGKEQDRYYLVVKYTYERAFPHHVGEVITYYNFYELTKSTVQRLEFKIPTNN